MILLNKLKKKLKNKTENSIIHFYNNYDEDKHKALSEAIRVAKRGGVIFASYCNKE